MSKQHQPRKQSKNQKKKKTQKKTVTWVELEGEKKGVAETWFKDKKSAKMGI